jgi:hypothetical protein
MPTVLLFDYPNFPIDTIIPYLPLVTIRSNNVKYSTRATIGDIITLSITSSERIDVPTAIIVNRTATLTRTSDSDYLYNTSISFNATLEIIADDIQGTASILVIFEDAAGNSGFPVRSVTFLGGYVTVGKLQEQNL